MHTLDQSTINRVAPPGSMRYFSALYAPEDKRDAVIALYVIDGEIRESAQSDSHDVAHTRLQWWRGEVDRLVNGVPQHPATRVLGDAAGEHRAGFTKLHELLAAADMDLARMTYQNARELRAYCSRSHGVVLELIAAHLMSPQPVDDEVRALANRIGVGIRQTEIVRDLRQDATDGRLYLPLDQMDAHGLTHADLRAKLDARSQEILRSLAADARNDLCARAPGPTASRLRPVHVLAALHCRLLDRIAARNYDVAGQRIELGPIEKPWVAWRAARSAGRNATRPTGHNSLDSHD